MSLERLLKRHTNRFVTHKTNKKTTKKGDGESLKRAIDSYLTERNTPTFKKLDGFHPSMHQVCPRWWYLMFRGVEVSPNIPSRIYRIFDNGHSMHERYQSYFKEMGILIGREVPVRLSEPVPVVGSADAIIDWGGHKLVELKSISPDAFQYRRVYNKPKDQHVEQAQVYMYALKLDSGFIIYEEKGSQEILIFDIKRDDNLIEKRLKRWSDIYKFIRDDVLPERPYKRESTHCKECDIANYCWDVLDG